MTDEEFAAARAEALNAILQSNDRLKLIVAGPGTGKTFTFQKLLEQTAGQGLAMTFLLVLVRDLETKFDDSVDVYSFHGFARSLLHHLDIDGITRGVHYFPPLSGLVLEDLRIVEDVVLDQIQLGSLYRNLADGERLLALSLESGSYYDAVGHDDAVYRVLRKLETRSDLVPEYSQLVVDEFQDFCPMEVALIKVLATKSPSLIVGDDDQALYAFRDASPAAIRELATGGEYTKFALPFCTRCTEVLVDATHAVVERAQSAGLLAGRLTKPYVCYMPEKRAESERFPKIRNIHCSVQTSKCPYMAMFIESAIREIATDDILESHAGGFPTVLIIGPKPFLPQIEAHLRAVFDRVSGPSKTEPSLDALYAYRLLAHDEASNLGWRILLQLLQPDGWAIAVQSGLDSGDDLCEHLTTSFVDSQLEIARLLAQWGGDEELSAEELAILASAIGVDPDGLEERIRPTEHTPDDEVDDASPTILLTSLMGSKGLQAGHVFIVGMNDQHFPYDNAAPTNEEACQLLVALTRARKSCSVVSTGRIGGSTRRRSVFIDWLGPHLAEVEYVNKAYFEG